MRRVQSVWLAAALAVVLASLAHAQGGLVITTTSPLPSGTSGVAYSTIITANQSATWSATGMPAGLTINPAAGTTTTISGTPAESGVFTNLIVTANRAGVNATQTFTLTIDSTTSLGVSLGSPSVFGKQLTLTATVSPLVPGDHVMFYDGANQLGAGVLNAGGRATLATRVLASGSHKLKAVYLGDGTNIPSTSTVITQVVRSVLQKGFLPAAPFPNNASAGDPSFAALGDFNEDGIVDVAVANFQTNNVSIFRGLGGGSFSQPSVFPAGAGASAIAVGDFNGDGHLDLAVANFGANSSTVSVLIGNGTGSFAAPVDYQTTAVVGGPATRPSAVAIGDTDGDDIPDIVVANFGTNTVSILRGAGDGTFLAVTGSRTFAVGTNPNGIVLGDFNGDGLTDIATANHNTSDVSVLVNRGGRLAFAPAVTYQSGGVGPTSIAAGDFDGNGVLDLAIANIGGTATTLHGNGDGTFTAGVSLTAGSSPNFIAVGDFDGDGKLDLVTANTGSNTLSVFLGNGGGGFGSATNYNSAFGDASPYAVAVGDFNADGISDLFVPNFASNDVNVFLGLAATATSLNISPNPIQFTDLATFTATVTSSLGTTPTGTVTFFDNGIQVLSPATLNASGVAKLNNVASGSVGSHPITAVYSGDSANATSTSSIVNFIVSKDNTTTTVTGNPNPSAVNQNVTLTATVVPQVGINHATGSVQFQDGGVNLDVPQTLSGGGVATLVISTLAAGSHSITAIYSGDQNDVTSTSSPALTQNVANATNTKLTTTRNPVIVNQAVTLSVQVAPAGGTGTVTFKDGGATIGSPAALDGDGLASVQTSFSTTGAHNLTATYSGDSSFAGSQDTLSENVVPPTTTSLTASPATVFLGQAVTLTATVVPSGASGTVVFFDGATMLGSGTLTGGTASLSTPLIGSGARKLRALYSGSASFGASASALLSKTIGGLAQAGFAAPVVYPTGPQTITSVVGDFNRDGKQDLAVLDLDFTSSPETGIVTILLGVGDGTFGTPQHIVVGSSPDDLAVGDFNGDGKPDLAFADGFNGLIILTGDGAGNFTVGGDQFAGPSVTRLAVADYNNDGIADLAFGSSSGVYVQLGVGDGTFNSLVRLISAEGVNGVQAVDMNSDGNADLVWLDGNNNLGIAVGNGDGTFNTPANYRPANGLETFAVADFTGDGTLDVVVGTLSDNVYLLPGNGDGTLGTANTIPVSADPIFVAAGDANGDGKQDIIVLDVISGVLSVVPGLGNGSFGAITTTDTGLAFAASGLTVGNFSGGTGRVDIAIPNTPTDDVFVLLGLPANVLLSCPTGSTPVVNGVAYSLTCTGSNGVGPYTYTQPSGTMPPGLTLNGSTGVISGTPTQTGSFAFTIKATDSDVPPQSLAVNLTLNVVPPLVFSSSPLPAAPVNAPYSNTLVSGGTPPYACVRVAGNFPAGLTFNNSTCALSGTPTVAGVYSFTLSVVDGGNPPQNGSPAFSLTIQQTSTTTVLTSSVNPTSFGDATTLTATVTPAAAGTVTFKDGATALGVPVTLVSGVATFTTSSLTGGAHSLTAVYNGDTNDAVSNSAPIIQNVNQISTTTSLGVAPSPSLVGQNITLTANVTPAAAAGTITFKDGAVVIGSPATIVSGSASISTATLTAGSHSLTAVYNSDTNDAGSTSPVVTQLVRNPATISLAIVPASPVFGQPATITVNMFNSPAPAGKVTFYDGTTVLGTSVLNGSGLASLVTPLLASGARSLTAYYQGSTTYTPVKSAPLAATVKTFAESGLAAAIPHAVGPNTRAVAVGDFDQDGIQDIAAGNYNGSTTNQVSILLGNGDGTFRTPGNYDAGSAMQAIAVADVNGDGLPDLVLATPGTNGVTVLLGTGGGAFGAPATFSASDVLALAVADFNGDGLADIVVGNTGGVRILQGNGDGTFQPALLVQSTSGPTYVTAADFNSDGNADIAAVDNNGSVSIQFGNGNSTFQAAVPYATFVSPISISATDLNNDGHPDVIVGDDGLGVKVLLGSATGALAAAVNYPAGNVPGYVATGDFNGDGKVDMAVADLSSARVSVLAGNGDGTFQTNVDYPTASPVYALVAGNFRSGDGRADLVVGYGPGGDIGVLLSQIPQVSINCTPGAPPVLTGVTYTITCTGSGGVPPYTYSQPTGTPPPGLALDSSTGIITGQPTTAGSYTFSIQAADSDTPVQTASKTVPVTVVTPLIMSATPLPAGTVNTAYTIAVASGGTPPYSCGLVAGAYPPGLTMNGAGCILSGTPTAPGSFSFTVGVSDSGSPQQNATKAFSLTIQQITTTTGLTSTLNPSTFGTSVSLTGTVSPGTATGSITILDNGTSIGSGVVSGGSFTVITTTLSTGTHPLTASYLGDVNFLPSTSGQLNQVVVPDPTTTTLTSSANPSVFGGSVTFTATISIAGATGTVTFKDGSTTLGPGTVTGGAATFSTASLTAGVHSITAAYGGDTNDATSTSSPLSQTVKAVSTTTLTSSGTPSTLGAAVTLTATVAPGVASGKVTFYNGTAVIGTGAVASGQATFTTSLLPAAADNLRAYYAGDAANTSSISAGITQTVNAGTEAGLRGPVSIPGTSNQPVSMAIGDFNHDGIADLVTADSGGALITVLLGTGGGAYTRATYAVGTTPNAVAIADFNGDGISDLAVANLTSNDVSILLGVGDGTFGAASFVSVAGHPVSVAVADFNHDGLADLAVVSNSTNTVTVLPGTGTGAFGAANILPVGAGPSSVAAGDFNNDGFADLVVANKGGNTLTVLLNTGTGAFGAPSTLTAASAPASVIVADFNGDGNADIAVANSASGTVGIFYGNGNTFTAMVPTTAGIGPIGLAAGDFNGDGKIDLAVSNAVDSTIQIFPADGSGLLGSPTTYPAGANPGALAAGDLNGDARTDLAVVDTGGNGESLFLGLAVSTTTLTSSLNPSTFGGAVTFTAAVTPPGATGTVTFFDGATSIGTGAVINGSATLLTSTLVAGGHPITASYGGDNNNGISTSTAVTQTVNKAASSTVLSSSLAPSTFGASVTFTATVSAGATGTVTFLDGATLIGSGIISGTTATLITTTLSVGTHSITASYGGDSNFLTSVSLAFSEVVNKAPTTTTLTAAPSPSTFGASVTLTATVAPTSSTGTVTFFDGVTSLGTGTLNGSGVATLAVSTLSVATHSLTASYPGDGNDTASTSLAISQTVNKASTTTTLTSSLNPSTFGGSVTLTAAISVNATPANAATGTVTFFEGATSLGTGTVAGGAATLTLSTLPGGTHSLTASYGGDGSFNGSVSVVFSQVVNPIATTTSLISSVNPSTSGQSITLKATLSQAAATGTVTFNDGSTQLGSASVSAGIATLPVSGLSIGTHSLTASYGGDADYAVSTSSPFSQTVRAPSSTTLSSSAATGATLGSPVTLTANVAPGDASGKVAFFDGVSMIGTATIASGHAAITTRQLASGTRSLSAYYLGSPVYGPGASNVLSETVHAIPQSGFAPNVTYTVGTNTPASAVADFNGDGLPDLVVAAFNGNGFGRVNILLNNGDGTFQPANGYSAGASLTSMAIGDFDGDGVPDVVVAVPASNSLNVLVSDGQGIPQTFFQVNDTNGPQSVVVGDFNGDGNADLAAGNADGTVSIFLGSGQTSFTPLPLFGSGGSPASLVLADFNGDRIADLGMTDANGFHVLLGNGDGTFSQVFDSPFTGGLSAAVGDFNGDGIPDVVVAAGAAAVVMPGVGDGTFGPAVAYPAGSNLTSVVTGDFNGDGLQDFAAGDIEVGNLVVFAGNGAGTFSAPATYHGNVVGLSVADFNGDGRTDIAAGDGSSGDAGVFLGAPAVPSVGCGAQNLPAILGSPYSLSCGAVNGLPPYTFSISQGALPNGLSVDPVTGTISGTPTVAANFTFAFTATDRQTPPAAGSATLSILVTTQLTMAAPGLPGGSANAGYSTVLAAGGNAPYTCTLTGGALPPGLTLTPSTCVLSGTTTTLGNFVFSIHAVDSGAPVQTASQNFSVAVSQFVSSTTLSSSPNPSLVGGQVTVSISVTAPNATGNVTISDGGSVIGTVALANGAALAQFNGFAIGSHSLTASYPGDTNNTPSTSAAAIQVVNLIPTTTSLSSSLNPSAFGDSVTFTAGVSPAATGTVTFKDGTTTVGSGNVNGNGVATFTSNTVPVGTHSLTATYNGDATRAASTSSPALSQTVNKASITTSLISSLPTSHFGENVTFTATLSIATATGTVTFLDGAATIGTGNVNSNGVATLTVSTLAVGQHSITASYSGDASYLGNTSAAVSQTVNAAVTTTTLTAVPNPSTFGQPVTLTITVTPSTATGTVTVNDSTNPVGNPVTLVNGSATFAFANFSVGSHSLTAAYGGDTNDAASGSSIVNQNVNLAPTTTVLTSSLNPALPNQAVTFTAIVSGAGANGSVTFSDAGIPLGDPVGYDGVPVSFTTSSLAPGPHTITAAYSGDSSYAGSVSSLIRSPLNFSTASPGTIADANGQGTGFTTRLSGTGGNLPANDSNLTLNTATGTLGLTSTAADLNAQVNLGAAEYVGIPLSSIGVANNEDFAVIGTFHNLQYSESFDQLGLFVGSSSTTAFRGGSLVNTPTPSAFTTQTVNGVDGSLQTDPVLAPAAGDDVAFTMSRTNGVWNLLVENLTTPTKTGNVGVVQPTYLNGLSTLVAGVFAANPSGSPKNEAVTAFALAVPVETIGKLPSTTTLTSSVKPSIVGNSITLTATVSPSEATGTVTFLDGTGTIGTGNLTNGTATLDISTLAFGDHQLTAVYSGDSITAVSTSITLDQVVNFTNLTITTTSLPGGTAGGTYGPVTLRAAGGSGNFTWSATGLPPGITLSAGGILSGASAAFIGPVNITVTDTTSTLTASQSFQLAVSAPAPPPVAPVTPLVISGPTDLGAVTAGGPVSGSFSASGGTQPYVWTLSDPSGSFGVDAGGHVTGNPTAVGNSTLTVTVTDSRSASKQASATYSVFGFTTSSLPGGAATVTYSASVDVGGGAGPYTFFATGVPAGLTFSGGTFSGKPQTAGNYAVTIQANDSKGLSVTRSFSISVAAAPPPTTPGPLQISSVSLPAGVVNQPYSQTLAATGGSPAYAWTQTGGALPAGLSLSASGTVSGLPSAPGVYSVGVQVTDTAGGKVAAAVAINIAPAQLRITTGATLPSGIANVDYPAQTLTATGGVEPYQFSVTGSLPPGLTLLDGQISGTPTATGAFGFTLKVTDSSNPPASGTLAMTVTVRPNSADLILSSGGVSFSLVSGAAGVPDAGAVTVSSSDVNQVLNYSVSAGSAPWLSVTGATSTPGNVFIGLSPAALALTAAGSPYSATVVVTCTSAVCSGKTQSIAVTLVVQNSPPELSVDSELLSFGAASLNPQASTVSFVMQNAGGGSLKINSVSGADPWLSVGTFPATLLPGPGARVSVTATPGSLPPGFYLSAVNVSTAAGSASIPVTLLIASDSSMNLGPAGAQFSMPRGGALGNSNGSFLVSVSKTVPVSFSASVLPGASWLTSSNGGVSSSASPGSVSYALNASAIAALPAGAYYGTIRVSASGIVNTPQDFQVVLSVASVSTPVAPDPQPAGLLFLSAKPGPQAPQTIQVYASSTVPLPFQASASMADGAGWLSVNTSTGSAIAGTPGKILASVDSTGLKAGVYRGSIGFSAGSAVRTVNVTLVVEPTALAASPSSSPVTRAKPAAAGPVCAGATLVATQTGLVTNFSAPASWPTPLAIKLVDSCGSIVGNGQIVATFSNGDPPLELSPVDVPNGLYSGTWTPRKSSSQITISAHATVPGYPAASIQIAGKVTPNAAPQLAPNGTLDVFHPQVGAGLGPGNIVQIYGSSLASQTAAPQVLPLPTEVQGTQVLIGGVASPLFYISPGQVNAQIPFELEAGKQYQVIVSANGALTTPQPIQLNAGAPSVLQFTSGLLVAQHQDAAATLISDAAPARPGEYIVLYMSGLGATDIPVPSGQPSPANPPANVLDTPHITLNGQPVTPLFAGLTPSLVGLYQINLQMPVDLADGTYDLVVSQSGVISNTTSLPVKK